MGDTTVPRDRTGRRGVTRATTAGLLASMLVLSACSGDQSALDPQGPFAQEPHDLIVPVFWIAAFVFVLVQGLLIYSIVRYRQRSDDDGSLPVQVHGNTKLEIFWTVIPAVILAVIAVPTVRTIFDLAGEPEGDFLTVEVIGHRWWFEYYYPDQDIYTANELVIPTDTPVRLEMTASDPARQASQGVIHSFWVPSLAGKQDLVPGQTTTLNIQADEEKRYLGACAEYCGLSHVNMRVRVDALEPAEFETWVEQQQQPAEVPSEGLAAEGHALFEDLGDRPACASCHQVYEGGDSRSPGTGPDLTHLLSREEFAGAILDMDEDTLRAWLDDPNELKPMQYDTDNQIGMPDLDLSEDELDALVAYLLTLE